MSKWIPLSKRFPEHRQKVLVLALDEKIPDLSLASGPFFIASYFDRVAHWELTNRDVVRMKPPEPPFLVFNVQGEEQPQPAERFTHWCPIPTKDEMEEA